MALKIQEKIRNDLLGREEINVALDTNSKSEDIRAELASLLAKDQELVVVKQILGRYGSKEFNVKAYAYDSKGILDKLESATKKAVKSQA